MGDYASYIMSLFTQVVLIFLIPFVLFKMTNKFSVKDTFKFFSYKKISWKAVFVAVGLGVIVFCLNVYVSNFFNSLIQLFGYTPSSSSGNGLPATWWVLVLNLLTTAVLPAICEETLHRGMLLRGNSKMGIKKSVLISGFLFGLLHLNIEQFFYASIIGLFLGYLCWCCDSIYPCMIIHFMNNALSVFLSFASAKGWAIGNIFSWISKFLLSNSLLGFVILILALVLLFMLACELTRFLIKDSFNYNFGKRQKQLTNMAVRENFFKQIENIRNDTNDGNSIYSTEKNIIYIDFREFMDFVSKNMEEMKNTQIETENSKIKNVDLKIKILLIGSFVLSAVVTFMTFVWGLFR